MRAEVHPRIDLSRLEESLAGKLGVAADLGDVARDCIALEDGACRSLQHWHLAGRALGQELWLVGVLAGLNGNARLQKIAQMAQSGACKRRDSRLPCFRWHAKASASAPSLVALPQLPRSRHRHPFCFKRSTYQCDAIVLSRDLGLQGPEVTGGGVQSLRRENHDRLIRKSVDKRVLFTRCSFNEIQWSGHAQPKQRNKLTSAIFSFCFRSRSTHRRRFVGLDLQFVGG